METKILENEPQLLDPALCELFRSNIITFEKELELQINVFLNCIQEKTPEILEIPRKRGRKRIRPSNPTKTEIMDKFWLRGFREFMKLNFESLKASLSDLDFWGFFIGKLGNPGKRKKYLSYSKHYKEFLTSNKSFCMVFIAWIMLYGSIKVPRRNFKGNWELYFTYLCTDLVQPCKDLVDVNDIKSSLRTLSSVFDKHIGYINEKIRIKNF